MRLKVKETFADPYGHDIVMHVWKEGCAVAQALGATGFQIRGRVAECVPYGHFLGGRWSRPVMTKAGGFGTDTTLLHVVNFIEEKLSV